MRAELSRLENQLTSENRDLVRTYIYNCNEDMFATILLSAFDRYEGLSLNNAFYLHELTELRLFQEEGYEFLDVEATPEFREMREKIYDSNRNPHLKAAELHCKYFQLKAQEMGYDLSLGTVIEYDPLTSRKDKMDLFLRDRSLKIIRCEREKAKEFFTTLAKSEALRQNSFF